MWHKISHKLGLFKFSDPSFLVIFWGWCNLNKALWSIRRHRRGPAWEKTWVSRQGGDKRVRWEGMGPNTWHTCLKMSQWKPCCIISIYQKKNIGKLQFSMSIFVSRNFYFEITKFGVRTTRLPRVCIINQSPQMWL